MDVKTAIRNDDVEALRTLLTEDASRANALIRWGVNDRNLTHPLHYVSDMLFDKTLKKRKALPIVGALIQAGADLDFQVDGKGDTPLIGAASLSAEEIGLTLLNAGAKHSCADSTEKRHFTGRRCLARIALQIGLSKAPI